MDDLKEKSGYWKLKEETLDRTVWRTHFGRGYRPVVRKTTEWMSTSYDKFCDKDCWNGRDMRGVGNNSKVVFLDFTGMSEECSEIVRIISPVRDSRKIRPEKEISG